MLFGFKSKRAVKMEYWTDQGNIHTPTDRETALVEEVLKEWELPNEWITSATLSFDGINNDGEYVDLDYVCLNGVHPDLHKHAPEEFIIRIYVRDGKLDEDGGVWEWTNG